MRNPRWNSGVFAQFASDGWDICMKNVNLDCIELLEKKKIFLISYNSDDTFLFKQLFPKQSFNEFIPFTDELDVFPFRVMV